MLGFAAVVEPNAYPRHTNTVVHVESGSQGIPKILTFRNRLIGLPRVNELSSPFLEQLSARDHYSGCFKNSFQIETQQPNSPPIPVQRPIKRRRCSFCHGIVLLKAVTFM
jgi:hypothetical protein